MAACSIKVLTKPVLDKGSLDFSLKINKSSLALIDTAFGVKLRMDDCEIIGEPGEPGFPSFVLRAALPPAGEITGLKISAVKTIKITTKPVFIMPLQEPQPGPKPREIKLKPSLYKKVETENREQISAVKITLPKIEAYKKLIKNPQVLAKIIRIEQVGVIPVAVIAVYPVSQTAKGLLELTIEATLSVAYEKVNPAKTIKRLPVSRTIVTIKNKIQAQRQLQSMRARVINPDWITDLTQAYPDFRLPDFFPGPIPILAFDYLIITDDQLWNETTMTATGPAGNLTAAFTRLVEWKKKRGLHPYLATVTDIVAGVYGNFSAGARDLQEVIRNFIKWAYNNCGAQWVLLGGDIGIIPIRRIAGPKIGSIVVEANNPPNEDKSFWTGNYLRMHLTATDWSSWPGNLTTNILVNPATGDLIPYDATGAANFGWYFCTNNNYNVFSVNPTDFVRVNGQAGIVNANLQWLYDANIIPTDFYYASLVGPNYNQAGLHDWDALDNGLYGQNDGITNHDGINYNADVSLGRAPVQNTVEADAFVNKLIAYEQFRRPDNTLLDSNWPRRMTFLSANWGGRVNITGVNVNPPTDNHYYHNNANTYTLIKLEKPITDSEYRLFVQVADVDIRITPYNPDAGQPGGRGWYFAQSGVNLSVSEVHIHLPFGGEFRFPIPTLWIVVYGPADELAPLSYIVDQMTADGSMNDQERLRKQIAADFPQINIINRLYEDEIDLPPADAVAPQIAHLTTARVQDALNNGPHFLSLSGHGSSNGCCRLSRDVAQNAVNGYHTCIGYADSCLTNRVDSEDAMSERLLQNANGGGVGYVGNTRFSWIGVGDDFQRAFFKELLNTRHLGLLHDSRLAFMHPDSRSHLWAVYSLNLTGDPEMPLWLGKPGELTVTHPNEIFKGNQNVQIRVKDKASNMPLSFAVVCLNLAGAGVFVTGITNAQGIVNLQINPINIGNMEVVVTAQDHIPYFGSIQVKEGSSNCRAQIINCRESILCGIRINCGSAIVCGSAISCGQTINCGTGINCRNLIMCHQLIGCPHLISCGVSISQGCRMRIGGCPNIDPSPIEIWEDIYKACGVKNITELIARMNTSAVKTALSKLSLEKKKAVKMMLARIKKENKKPK